MMKKGLIFLLLVINLTLPGLGQHAGNALNFDGSTSYCSANLPTVFDNISSNDFTVEAWVKPVTSTGTKRVFFAQKDANNFCSILINSSNVPYFFIGKNGSSYSANSQTSLSSSTWNHIAFTWDASANSIGCYINGSLVSVISGGSSSLGNNQMMTIGSRTDGTQNFNGSIDEFRIWSDIRTSCEIFGSMNSRFTVAQPNLVASYSFNQGVAGGTNTGVTSLSELNNNYNATLNGFQLTGTSSNWVASGASVILSNNNSSTHYEIDEVTACDSYLWTDGNTYTSSNNSSTHTYVHSNGCTVVENLDLIVNYSTSRTDVITACDSYLWMDGNTYTSSNNTATYTLPNAAGCDSIVTLNLTLNHSTSGTDVITACDSYLWIDGNTYTSSNNTATHTLPNASGCDSIVTLNLTLNHSTSGTDMITACDSYLWIDGNTYTSSNNTATHTLPNASGCDSIVTLNLTLNHSTSGTDMITACDSYLWIDGNTYTSNNNTATYTLPNALGCDSIVTLNLTLNHSTSGTDVITACDSYLWIDGNTYTSSNNTATYILPNALGCDSIVTLNLTLNHSTFGTDVITACDSYLWIDGNTYTSNNNTATYTLPNAAGCDSIVTLDLVINATPDNAVVTSGVSISSLEISSGIAYQWIDCDNGNAEISGETNASFTAVVNGSYAVTVDNMGCTATSSCIYIGSVGIEEKDPAALVKLYPNPAREYFILEVNKWENTIVQVYDVLGSLMHSQEMRAGKIQIDTKLLPKGIYLVHLEGKDVSETRQLVVQ